MALVSTQSMVSVRFNARRRSCFSWVNHAETAAEHLCLVVLCVLLSPTALHFYRSTIIFANYIVAVYTGSMYAVCTQLDK